MKHSLLALFLLLATASYAQQPIATAPVQFCTLMADGRRFDKADLKLDYGQNSKAQAQDAALAEADVQIRQLNSIAAALNYMTRQGWEVVTVTAMAGGSSPMGTNTLLGYLLRRKP